MKQDHIKVQKARDSDLDVLIDLSEQLGYPTTREDFQKRFSALSQEDDQVILVAEIKEQGVVGWVHVLPRVLLIVAPLAEIGGLVVDKKNRGKGIGRILMAAAEKWAKSRGYPAVTVRSNIVREGAHDFYLNVGYTHIKTSRVYIKQI
jgi:GNAT superfamily N-acetyltransferase